MEPAAAAPSPAMAAAATICTGTAPGLVHHHTASAATTTAPAATHQIQTFPVGAGAPPRSIRS